MSNSSLSVMIWRRRQDRLAALFPLIAVALFAALSYWLDARVSESARVQQRATTQQAPDHFLENFKLERTAPDGHIERVMTGQHASHYPDAKKTVVEHPKLDNYPADKPEMKIEAERAVLSSEGARNNVDRIDFSGKVIAHQVASVGRDAITYESDTLTVYPQTQRARTDATTRTISGDRVMITQGLELDAENKQGSTRRGIQIELTPKGQP